MTWKAIGDWFVLEILQTSQQGGIVSISENTGTIISCNYPEYLGKEAIFRNTNGNQSQGDYTFVEFKDIMAVME